MNALRALLSLLPGLVLAACLSAGPAARAAEVTLHFSASGFTNAGIQYPGLDSPISGSIRWDNGGDRMRAWAR